MRKFLETAEREPTLKLAVEDELTKSRTAQQDWECR
jgi:hypothetical protein